MKGNDKDLFPAIHNLLMDGVKKKDIISFIIHETGCVTSTAYKKYDKYMKDPTFLADRDDVRESFKKGLFQIYYNNVNKGFGRAACEAADRIMVLCPWIKEKDDDHVDTNIKVVIEEWTKKD